MINGKVGHGLDDLQVSTTSNDILTSMDTSSSSIEVSESTTTLDTSTCSGLNMVEGKMSEFRSDVVNLQFDVHHLIYDVSLLRSQVFDLNSLITSRIVATVTILMTPEMTTSEIMTD